MTSTRNKIDFITGLATFIFAISFFGVGRAANAAPQGNIPSCYAANNIEIKPTAPLHDVTVLIDKTTLLDEQLKQSVMHNVGDLLGAGSSFSIIRFSAYAQGRYTSVLARGILESPLSNKVRDSLGSNVLKRFDACMGGQLGYGRRLAAEAVGTALADASGNLVKSNIYASLREASAVTREAPSKDRIVVLVSDMLENSTISSFYAKKAVRSIDVPTELSKVEKAGLYADFGRARVYVIGAGLVSPDTESKNVVRDPIGMQRLEDFWSAYLSKSNAKLMEFGKPALLNPIK